MISNSVLNKLTSLDLRIDIDWNGIDIKDFLNSINVYYEKYNINNELFELYFSDTNQLTKEIKFKNKMFVFVVDKINKELEYILIDEDVALMYKIEPEILEKIILKGIILNDV